LIAEIEADVTKRVFAPLSQKLLGGDFLVSFVLSLPTWPIIRVLGIMSFILLTVGICLGITYGMPFWSRSTKGTLYKIHSIATISGTALGLLHGVVTVIDTYVTFSWKEVLIPFTAQYSPILSGLGTLCGYGMLIVILTTDLRNKIKRKVWLALHMLSYPIFIMALIHGFFIGTDSSLPGIRMMYTGSIILVLALTAIRSAMPPAHQNVTMAREYKRPTVVPGIRRDITSEVDRYSRRK
jgi:predicted ferric reductase